MRAHMMTTIQAFTRGTTIGTVLDCMAVTICYAMHAWYGWKTKRGSHARRGTNVT
jgi:hypothetical protein